MRHTQHKYNFQSTHSFDQGLLNFHFLISLPSSTPLRGLADAQIWMPVPYLPEELLQLILWHLKLPLGSDAKYRRQHELLRHTLVSCMLASRAFHRLAEPVLYHTITSDRLIAALQYATFKRRKRIQEQVRELYATDYESHVSTWNGVRPSLHGILSQAATSREWPARFGRVEIERHRNWNMTGRRRRQYSFPDLFRFPIATLQVKLCTRLQVLVLSNGYHARIMLPSSFLRACAVLTSGSTQNVCIYLANLRRFVIEPQFPDTHLDDDLDLHSDDWFLHLARLPCIQSISVPMIMEQALVSSQEQSSNLKRLALTNEALTPRLLKAILKTFPNLKELSVTWPVDGRNLTATIDVWPQLGYILCQHGPLLRKVYFDTARLPAGLTPRGAPIDLALHRNLRSLTLPIEAVLTEPAGRYLVPIGEGENELPITNEAYEGMNTPTRPLDDLLPSTSQHLTIMDDWNLWADAYRLDIQLRGLMVSPTFSELRSIRVRRRRCFAHLRSLDWCDRSSNRFWQVAKRVRSTR